MVKEKVPARSPSFAMVTVPERVSPGFMSEAVRMAAPALLLVWCRLPAVNTLAGLAELEVNEAPEPTTAEAAMVRIADREP